MYHVPQKAKPSIISTHTVVTPTHKHTFDVRTDGQVFVTTSYEDALFGETTLTQGVCTKVEARVLWAEFKAA